MQDRMRKIAERKRTIVIIEATGEEVNRINVELRFSAGGMNYATYKNEERGYWLSVQPEHFKDEGRFTSTMTQGFSGIKHLT